MDTHTPAPKSECYEASTTQSLDRAMLLLEKVVNAVDAGLPLTRAAALTGLSKPTAHRLLNGLRNAGLVDYESSTHLFFPAFKLCTWGEASRVRFDVVKHAQPFLKALAAETSDTIYLTVRSGDEVLCVAREQGSFPIRTLTLSEGDLRPLGLGSNGVVLLASESEEEQERLITEQAPLRQQYPSFNPENLRQYVSKAVAQGYFFNEGLMLPEMSAVAMGVRSQSGQVAASISVAAITSRFAGTRFDEVLSILRQAVCSLEAAMRVTAGQEKEACK